MNRELLAKYGRDVKFRHAYIGGTFDCLHRGHLELLRKVREIAERTTVSVNTDEFCERYKRRPLMPYSDRFEALRHCVLIDRVICNVGHEDSKRAVIHASQALTWIPVGSIGVGDLHVPVDCIVHGDDWTGEALMRQMSLTEEWLAAHQIQMVYVPYSQITSTSAILTAYADRCREKLTADLNDRIRVGIANADANKCSRCGYVSCICDQ